MDKLAEQLKTLLRLASKADESGMFDAADDVQKSLVKIAQQMQMPGNAYSYIDPTGMPPALYSILATLQNKVNTLDVKIQQQQQQMGTQAKPQQQQQSPEAQQALQQNQNAITPSTVNYVQTPGSTPAPIEMDGGELNV